MMPAQQQIRREIKYVPQDQVLRRSRSLGNEIKVNDVDN